MHPCSDQARVYLQHGLSEWSVYSHKKKYLHNHSFGKFETTEFTLEDVWELVNFL